MSQEYPEIDNDFQASFQPQHQRCLICLLPGSAFYQLGCPCNFHIGCLARWVYVVNSCRRLVCCPECQTIFNSDIVESLLQYNNFLDSRKTSSKRGRRRNVWLVHLCTGLQYWPDLCWLHSHRYTSSSTETAQRRDKRRSQSYSIWSPLGNGSQCRWTSETTCFAVGMANASPLSWTPRNSLSP